MNPLAKRNQKTSKALWRVLPAISRLEDATDKEDHAGSVNPRRVVAVAWSSGRLERARRLLEEGQTPPPIEVSRYRLEGRPDCWLYVPSDGMHRARAAQLAGRKRIGARIGGEILCRPQRYLLYRSGDGEEGSTFLYEDLPDQPYAKRVPGGSLEATEVEALRAFGVPYR